MQRHMGRLAEVFVETGVSRKIDGVVSVVRGVELGLVDTVQPEVLETEELAQRGAVKDTGDEGSRTVVQVMGTVLGVQIATTRKVDPRDRDKVTVVDDKINRKIEDNKDRVEEVKEVIQRRQ